jgi:hypothetical protein
MNMDLTALEQELTKRFQVPFSCRHRAMVLENPSPEIPYNERPKGIHFETDARQLDQAIKCLHEAYASARHKTSEFPCGYRMRIIPPYDTATSIQQPRVMAMINRQETFQTMIHTVRVMSPMIDLDYKHSKINLSIRDMIMGAQPPVVDAVPTFLAVKKFRSELLADCLEDQSGRARQIFRHLLPYFRYAIASDPSLHADGMTPEEIQQAVDSYFPPDMQAEARDKTWDPQTDGIVTPFDTYLVETSKPDDLFDFSGMEEPFLMPTEPTAQQEHVQQLVYGRTDDSISTFYHRDQSPPASRRDDDTVDSQDSIDSMETRLTSRLNQHEEHYAILNESLNLIIQAMKAHGFIPTQITASQSATTPSTITNHTMTTEAIRTSPNNPDTPPTAVGAAEPRTHNVHQTNTVSLSSTSNPPGGDNTGQGP